MIKKLLISTLLILGLQGLSAQSNNQADQILNDLLNTAKTSAIRTNFRLEVTIKADPQAQVSTGSFTLKGTKFTLDLPQMKVWFNGKTQWAYSSQSNEVTITEPTEKELAETNPLAIISGFRSKSIARISTRNKNPQVHLIEMLAQNKKSEITKIEVTINKSTGNPASIKTVSINGTTTMLKLNSFQKGVTVTDQIFQYNPSRFKGANINDLR